MRKYEWVVSDHKNGVGSFQPHVLSLTDYYPFGAPMETGERTWAFVDGNTGEEEGYRYGFQNQEQDKELWEGAVTFKYRVEDPRLGRFFGVDPLTKKYPWNSSYAFSENKLIAYIDLEGLESIYFGSKCIDFTGMTLIQIESKLYELEDKHYGNLRADEIMNYMKPGEIWQVRNLWSSGVCVGTIIAKYDSEADRERDHRSYASDVRRSRTQAFWNFIENADVAKGGREGLDAWCEIIDGLGKFLSTIGDYTGAKQVDFAGKCFSTFTDISQVAADYDTLPKELADRKTAVRLCFKITGEIGENAISAIRNNLVRSGIKLAADCGLDELEDLALKWVEREYYSINSTKKNKRQ